MSPGAPAPVCRILAGPNGAGKTTFALKYLPQVSTAFAALLDRGLGVILEPENQLISRDATASEVEHQARRLYSS